MKRSIPQHNLFSLAEKIGKIASERHSEELPALHLMVFSPDSLNEEQINNFKERIKLTDMFQHTSEALKTLSLKKPRRPSISTEAIQEIYDRVIQERTDYFLQMEYGDDIPVEAKKAADRIVLQYRSIMDRAFAEIADHLADRHP